MAQPDTDQAPTTPAEATPAAHPDARLAALSQAADPMLLAFGGESDPPPPAPPDGETAATPPAPPPAGHPAAAQPEPARQTPPDADTAAPEELLAYARQHPTWAKAIGLEVRQHIQRRNVEFQREQEARQQAEYETQVARQQTQAAQEQAQQAATYYDALYDDDDPRHLDALAYFAQLGVQPMEIRNIVGSPVVQQHVRTVASEAAQQAAQQATREANDAAITAALKDPTLGHLGAQALNAVWLDTEDMTIPGFYTRAHRAAGWLDPKQVAELRQAAEAAARTQYARGYPPAEGSVVPNGDASGGASPYVPPNKQDIDPVEFYARAFGGGRT